MGRKCTIFHKDHKPFLDEAATQGLEARSISQCWRVCDFNALKNTGHSGDERLSVHADARQLHANGQLCWSLFMLQIMKMWTREEDKWLHMHFWEDFNCYSQLKDQYKSNLQNGFVDKDGAYHPALKSDPQVLGTVCCQSKSWKPYHPIHSCWPRTIIVINEPDLKIPGISKPAEFCRPGAQEV